MVETRGTRVLLSDPADRRGKSSEQHARDCRFVYWPPETRTGGGLLRSMRGVGPMPPGLVKLHMVSLFEDWSALCVERTTPVFTREQLESGVDVLRGKTFCMKQYGLMYEYDTDGLDLVDVEEAVVEYSEDESEFECPTRVDETVFGRRVHRVRKSVRKYPVTTPTLQLGVDYGW